MHNQENQVNSECDNLFCRARILYIDDDKGLGLLLQKRLKRMAYTVDVTHSGEEGLKMFAEGVYDVVITDYLMPDVNGLEVLRDVKNMVPVIVLTGEGDAKVAVDAMKLGAADYIAKDVTGEYIEFLPSIIDRVMERQQLIRDRRQAVAKLKASEARYKAVVDDQTEVICRFHAGGKLTFANSAFCRYFGIRQTDLHFQNLATILSRKTYLKLKAVLKTLTPQNPVAMGTDSIKMVDGKVHWLHWTSRAIFDDAYKLREYQLVGRDITEFKRVEEALRESEEKNSALLNAIPDPILRIDRQGTCMDLRPEKDQVLNLSSDFIGKNIAEFFPPDIATLMLSHINKLFVEGISQVFQFKLWHGDSVTYQEARLVLAGGDEALAIIRDVTERTQMEQQLQNQSIHDSLTGLYNRAYFEEEIRRLESGRYNPIGIVVCDVDGLKMVNDNLGHSKGDELLKAAGFVILNAFRGSDAVARIGGDEFAILLPNSNQETVEEACKRLNKMVAQYNEGRPEMFLSISVGAAVRNNESQNLGQVFQQADEAMYGDKLQRSKTVRNAILQTLRGFWERKEIRSREHSERVKVIMHNFGRVLGFTEDRFPALDLFSEYHDIGKVALPENILANKKGINTEQYGIVKRHCEVGHRIALSAPILMPVAEWILKHHEWWDGSGYPLGLKGQEIPLECRMLTIADAYESMTRGRYIDTAKSPDEALAELRRCAGTQFDPKLVEVFVQMVMDNRQLGELSA